jgi:hypothetical protein
MPLTWKSLIPVSLKWISAGLMLLDAGLST